MTNISKDRQRLARDFERDEKNIEGWMEGRGKSSRVMSWKSAENSWRVRVFSYIEEE